MARVYLGLGSNIDAETNLKLAMRELRATFGELEVSPVYRCPAVGFEGDDFLNLVVGLDSQLAPADIHSRIEAIHDLAGRKRGSDPFQSRPLDIDLLLYDDLVMEEGRLRLPRRDVLDYAFVLKPLVDIAPDLVHPQSGRRLAEHWAEFDQPGQPLAEVDVIL